MTSYPPEYERAETMIRGLAAAFRNLDPMERQASLSLTRGDDPHDEKALLGIMYGLETVDAVDTAFNELIDHLEESYYETRALLANQWGVSEESLVGPENLHQTIAEYDTDAYDIECAVIVSKWEQTNPATEAAIKVLHVSVRPYSVLKPAQRLIYLEGIPLDARKIPQVSAIDSFRSLIERILPVRMPVNAYQELGNQLANEFADLVNSSEKELDGKKLVRSFDVYLEQVPDLAEDVRIGLVKSLQSAIKELGEDASEDTLTPDDIVWVEKAVRNIPYHI